MKETLDNVVAEYRRRDADKALLAKYSLTTAGTLFIVQNLERALIELMTEHHLLPFTGEPLLDFGCGTGGVLQYYIRLGANPANLYGCDLLDYRIEQAKAILPGAVSLIVNNDVSLPYESEFFGIVHTSLVFSSVLDRNLRREMADELWRILKPGGSIIWYDFHFAKPGNNNVRAVSTQEVRLLFPKAKAVFKRVTLRPWLTYRLAPRAWMFAQLLSKIPWLCTHHLGILAKPIGEA